MRIGIDASDMVAEHLTGIEYALTELTSQLPKIDTQSEFALYLNFTRPEYAKRFSERVQPLLSERVKAYICRIPNRVMQVLSGPLRWPLDWTTGRCDSVLYPSFIMHAQRHGARVATIHDLMPITHPEYFSPQHRADFQRIVPRLVRQADALIAVSEYTKSMLVEKLGVAAQRVRVVHHGVSSAFCPAEPDRIKALRRQYGLPRPYVLFVGTAEPRKNLPRLVKAIAHLRTRFQHDVDLVIAGKAAWGSSELRTCIDDERLHRNVHLLGHARFEELPVLYSGALAAVQPSIVEGFGMPILEAMACGTPVVAANASSLPEVCGGAALLFDPHNVEELALLLNRLIEESALRSEFARRGKIRAAQFTWAKSARETLAVLRDAA